MDGHFFGAPLTPPARRAFTLIELLVVVSIISILAAIAVPNFLEAQVRAKVSRMRNDMRSLATAVESYRADHNRYPPRSKFPTGASFRGVGTVTSPDCVDCRIRELSVFTSPIAYISSIPADVFENAIAPPNNVIDYYEPILVDHMSTDPVHSRNSQGLPIQPYPQGMQVGAKYGWALMSVGPDGVFGTRSNLGNYPPQTRTADQVWFNEYDPTNGTISAGNLWRFQRSGTIANEVFDPNW